MGVWVHGKRERARRVRARERESCRAFAKERRDEDEGESEGATGHTGRREPGNKNHRWAFWAHHLTPKNNFKRKRSPNLV